MITNFREFLYSNLLADGAVRIFAKRQFGILNEMAEYKDKPRKAVHIDSDDVEFLRQFPHEYWGQAMHVRYRKLFERLKKMHEIKITLGFEQLKQGIYEALRTQTDEAWHKLRKLEEGARISRRKIEELRSDYPASVTHGDRPLPNREILDIAEKVAHDHIKAKNTHLPGGNEPEEFTFRDTSYDPETDKRRGNRSRQLITIMAKPYLNRFYHKLEQTGGIEHHAESGLTGQGEYGFDMSNPIEAIDFDPDNPDQESVFGDSTSGLRFPKLNNLHERLKSFLVLNSHSMFGNLPSGPDIKWMPSGMEDTHTVGWHRTKILARIMSKLRKARRTDGRMAERLDTEPKLRAEAKRRTEAQLLKMARSKKLFGPPVPGVPDEKRSATIDARGRIKNPPLFLPYRKEKVQVKQGDRVVEKESWIPVVNSSHLYRKLNSSDYKVEKYKDEFGREKTRKVIIHPEDKLRGFSKDFIKVDGNEQYGKSVQGKGSIHLNYGTESIKHMVKHTPGFNKKYGEIFGDQQEVGYRVATRTGEEGRGYNLSSEHGSGLYDDIVGGILDCVDSGRCGGNTEFESTLMLQSVPEIHQIIYQTILLDIDNKDLLEKGSRKDYVKSKTSLYAQKNWGGGSRRLRAFTDQAREMFASIQARPLEHGQDRKLHNYRKMVEEISVLRRRAHEADQQSVDALSKSRVDLGPDVAAQLMRIVSEKKQIAEQSADILQALYTYVHAKDSDYSPERARQFADDQVESWIEAGMKSEKMVASLQRHPLVVQAMSQLKAAGHSGNLQISSDARIDDETDYAKIYADQSYDEDLRRLGGNTQDEQMKTKYAPAAGGMSRFVLSDVKQKLQSEFRWLRNSASDVQQDLAKILRATQDAINKKMQIRTAPATRPGQPRNLSVTATPWQQLRREQTPKANFQLAMNKNYHRVAIPTALRKLKKFIVDNKESYSEDDYKRAIEALESSMRDRGIQ
jgi:hypothetical protein